QLKAVGSAGLDGAIIRRITDPNINRIRVRILIPQLSSTDTSTGDVSGTSVAVRVDLRPSGGDFSTVGSRSISGKCLSQYEFTITFDVTGDGPWDIRVVRETNDSQTQYLQNNTYFSSFTEIIDAKLRYPNSAIIAMSLDAQNFQSLPRRYYDL